MRLFIQNNIISERRPHFFEKKKNAKTKEYAPINGSAIASNSGVDGGVEAKNPQDLVRNDFHLPGVG
jgi:hypothetical protein